MKSPLLYSIDCLKSCHAQICFILGQLFSCTFCLLFLEITHSHSVPLGEMNYKLSIIPFSLLSCLLLIIYLLVTTDFLFFCASFIFSVIWILNYSYYFYSSCLPTFSFFILILLQSILKNVLRKGSLKVKIKCTCTNRNYFVFSPNLIGEMID